MADPNKKDNFCQDFYSDRNNDRLKKNNSNNNSNNRDEEYLDDEYMNEEYSDEEYLSEDNLDYDSLNNENIDNNSLDNNLDLEVEEDPEEKEQLEECEEVKPKKTPLQHLEKWINIASGLFLALAKNRDHPMYYYFTAAMLFLISSNVLSLWNKAIQKQVYHSNRFRLYFYLRTLIGIIIAICAYDIFLTEHYDTSSYRIILWCLLILYSVECIDEVLEKYRSKLRYGKTRALLSCSMHSLLCVIIFVSLLWVSGLTLYLSPNRIKIEPSDTITVQSVDVMGYQDHFLDFYTEEEASMEEDKLRLLLGELEEKELSPLKWDEYLNYKKMKLLCKSYYSIDFQDQNASDNILSHGTTCINVIGNQAFLVVDWGNDDGFLLGRKNRVYKLQLSNKTMNMLKNYFAKLQR